MSRLGWIAATFLTAGLSSVTLGASGLTVGTSIDVSSVQLADTRAELVLAVYQGGGDAALRQLLADVLSGSILAAGESLGKSPNTVGLNTPQQLIQIALWTAIGRQKASDASTWNCVFGRPISIADNNPVLVQVAVTPGGADGAYTVLVKLTVYGQNQPARQAVRVVMADSYDSARGPMIQVMAKVVEAFLAAAAGSDPCDATFTLHGEITSAGRNAFNARFLLDATIPIHFTDAEGQPSLAQAPVTMTATASVGAPCTLTIEPGDHTFEALFTVIDAPDMPPAPGFDGTPHLKLHTVPVTMTCQGFSTQVPWQWPPEFILEPDRDAGMSSKDPIRIEDGQQVKLRLSGVDPNDARFTWTGYLSIKYGS